MKKILSLLCTLLLPLSLATLLQGAPENSFVSTLLRIAGILSHSQQTEGRGEYSDWGNLDS